MLLITKFLYFCTFKIALLILKFFQIKWIIFGYNLLNFRTILYTFVYVNYWVSQIQLNIFIYNYGKEIYIF